MPQAIYIEAERKKNGRKKRKKDMHLLKVVQSRKQLGLGVNGDLERARLKPVIGISTYPFTKWATMTKTCLKDSEFMDCISHPSRVRRK